MSDRKLVVNIEGSDHDESTGEELEVLHSEMTSIHSDLSSTAEHNDDGEEIVATALEGASVQSAVRINVYENIPFAGGDGDYSILSVLFGAHSIGGGIFGFLNMIDSNKVRVQCRECQQAVKDFPWMDAVSKVTGSVKKWRAAFPCARAIEISHRMDIVDADFVHIRGDERVRLHTVIMRQCLMVSDAALIYLRGIHTLNILACWQFSDASFANLRGLHTLFMQGCIQLSDAAFVHLRGIQVLDMSFCYQDTITGATFSHLRGIRTLTTDKCSPQVCAAAAALLADVP